MSTKLGVETIMINSM